MKTLFTLILCIFFTSVFAAKPKHQYVRIKTDMGECIVKLYNETPLHRDNFLKLAKAHVYDGTLFHRVIKDFMIQGGDPDSRKPDPKLKAGKDSVNYTVPAEFRDSLFHKKGVLAAARDNNPEKASSGSQFYLVQGKTFTDEQLDDVEIKRLKFKIPKSQREVYKSIGGTPHLDRNYTVYGEVVKGLEMVDKIASVVTAQDKPVTDVVMTVTILKKRESKKLEKELNTQTKL
ncbi:peptidylprolyl isomerase [Pedobacter metabolipauper]|uniref:peptidylprolyl isomerase n=1 Tax=Pedobacter metabolipauper TaxID=425513 RepID=A0A4R6SWS6_9SPHI|nr:peptidylprolyl isomerase [Pedobacter metabolipauper]TDQ09593.1 peptidyl-prolyl cis-trans isomerase B (cyclophilin B) [Pedobacter metabolipauper]